MEENERKDQTEDGEAFSEFTEEKGRKNARGGKIDRKKLQRRLIAGLLAVAVFGGGFAVGRLTLDPEMQSLIQLKNAIQKEYYLEVDDAQFYNVIFDAINDQLLDPYSRYMTADEYASQNAASKGQQSGIGVTFLTKTDDGFDQMLVSRVSGNSPAEAAGLKEGDRVIAFGKSESEMTESVVFTDFSAFLGGCATGEEFFLLLLAENGEQRTVSLSKQAYVENYVFYRSDDSSYGFVGANATELKEVGTPLACLDADTAYIRLTRFYGAAAKEFAGAMNVFKEEGKKDLVLDLRGNGGGALDIAQEISSYFCKNSEEKYPAAVIADYGEKIYTFKAKGNYYKDYFTEDSRICILADSSSASASECLIGVMVDYGATAYGDVCLIERNGVAKTYGKGIMQTTYNLPGFRGDAVKLTTATIRWPVTGKTIHGVGVLPEDGALVVGETYKADGEVTAAIEALFRK